jgi:hypothetical protein
VALEIMKRYTLHPKNLQPIKSDLVRIARMKDEDIDYSDIPELGDEFFTKEAVITKPAHDTRTGADLIAAMQASPHRDIDIEPERPKAITPMKKPYSFEEEETGASYFLAPFRLISSDDPADIARLEKFTGLTQAEMVDLFIEDPLSCELQATDELEPFTGHRGTPSERLKALRLALEHLPSLYRSPDWDDTVTALLLYMVLQHCGGFRLVGDKTEHFLESKAIRANIEAMKALAEEGYIAIETTEEDQPLTATVTIRGWLLFRRFMHEKDREKS